MHELSLAQSVIDLARGEMARHPGAVLTGLEVKVGTLAGVELETFRSAMHTVLQSTGYGNARFTLAVIPGQARCLACGAEFEARGRFPECPVCGSGQCVVTSGREFTLSSLTLSVEPE